MSIRVFGSSGLFPGLWKAVCLYRAVFMLRKDQKRPQVGLDTLCKPQRRLRETPKGPECSTCAQHPPRVTRGPEDLLARTFQEL